MSHPRSLRIFCVLPIVALVACGGGGGKKGAASAPLLAPQWVGYTNADPVLLLADPVTPKAPLLAGGAATYFQIEPALPAGLVLDAATGVLSGAPAEPWPATTHTVTASNAAGAASFAITLEIPAPSMALAADRPLVRSVVRSASVSLPMHSSGFGTFLVGPSPEWTPAPLVGAAPAAQESALGALPLPAQVPSPAPQWHNATLPFTAQVELSATHLPTSIPWVAQTAAPYGDVAAELGAFQLATAALSDDLQDGELAVELIDPTGTLATLHAEPIATTRLELTLRALEVGQSGGVDGDVAHIGGHLAFVRADGFGRRKLYTFDLASGEVRRALDMLPGGDDAPRLVGNYRGRLLLAARNNPLDQVERLYTFDPATDTLLSLFEIWPHNHQAMDRVSIAGDTLVFGADMDHGTRKLFRYVEADGASPRIELAANLAGNTGDTDGADVAAIVGDDVYFVAAPLYGGRKLYRLRAGEVHQITDLRGPGADDAVQHVTAVDGRLFFSARTYAGGSKLFAFDPATDTLGVVVDLMGSAAVDDAPRDLCTDGARLFFVARRAPGLKKMFALDLATGQVVGLGDTAGVDEDDQPRTPTVHEAGLYFSAKNAAGGRKLFLWSADGGALTTVLDARANPALDDTPRHMTAFAGRLAFVADTSAGVSKLFVADPDAGWVALAADVEGPFVDDAPRPRLVLGNQLWFSAGAGPEQALYTLSAGAPATLP